MALSSFQCTLIEKIFLGFHCNDVSEFPDDFLDELLLAIDKGLEERQIDIKILVRRAYSEASGKRKRSLKTAAAVERIWPAGRLHRDTCVLPSTIIKCTRCQKTQRVDELCRQNGKQIPKSEHPGEFWQTVYFLCQCDLEHPLVVDRGDGNLVAILFARAEILW